MSAAAEIPWTSQDAERGFNPVFENAPLAMMKCLRQGTITAWNPALEQLLGGRTAVAGRFTLGDLVGAQDRGEAERLLAQLFRRERDGFQMEVRAGDGNGETMRWSGWRVQGDAGKADYALIALEEISRGQAVERRQRQSQAESLELVGRLAGGVTHDFNNLLTGVLLYCDLVLANLETGHRARRYAEEIRNASMQATGLVRQLLTVARPQASTPRVLSLNDTAEGMRDLLRRLIGENIELTFQLDEKLGLVRIDPTQAQQILLNLVLNARDALAVSTRSDEEKAVEQRTGERQIRVETRNCHVQVLTDAISTEPVPALLPCALFVVEDNGCGMDAATRNRLFEAFFTTKSGRGTGLGLSTVHDIVTGSGGLIHVESAPERGTRVSVLLPLVPEAVAAREGRKDSSLEENSEIVARTGNRGEE